MENVSNIVFMDFQEHVNLATHSAMYHRMRIKAEHSPEVATYTSTQVLLTHWGLVMPFGDIDLGQLWLR